MEALSVATIAALTVYDMCKAVDKGMVVGHTYLLEKSEGKVVNLKATCDTIKISHILRKSAMALDFSLLHIV